MSCCTFSVAASSSWCSATKDLARWPKSSPSLTANLAEAPSPSPKLSLKRGFSKEEAEMSADDDIFSSYSSIDDASRVCLRAYLSCNCSRLRLIVSMNSFFSPYETTKFLANE